jgi:hypothetical protein
VIESFLFLVFENHRQVGPISTTFDFFYNFYQYLSACLVFQKDLVGPVDRTIRRLIDPNYPSVVEMLKNSSFIWTNTHIFSDFARATSPKVKYIGGIAIKKPDQLNEVG